jgi:2-aminobenzoate-CoA ligase
MRKYASVTDPSLAPSLVFPLPELVYPEQLNAARVCIEGATAAWSGHIAFLYGETRLSFHDVQREVGRYAEALRRLGVASGDRVLIRLADTPALVFAILATQAIGAVAVPTYVQLRSDDLLYRVRDSGAKVVLVSADLLAEMRPVAANAGRTLRVAALPRDPDDAFEALDDLLPPEPVAPEYAETHADDVALILYTSGSTGRSKGTLHSHRDILAICDTYARYCVKPAPGDVIGGPAALPFALGIAFFVYYPLRFGCSAVLEPDKSPDTAFRLMQRHGVSIFVGVASYYTRLLALVRARGEKPARLRLSLTGGEPLLAEVERGWRETTGLVLAQFLGTTEMLGCFLGSRHGEDRTPAGAIGLAIPGYECSVRDPATFAPVPAGAPGLLCMRGPTGTVYWNRPDEQRKVVRDGWNVFQDVVVRDDRGFIRYVSRSDDMIVSAGYNISPVDVETVLIRHPSVAECACVPAPDPGGLRAHVVKAYVVPRDGAAADDALKRALQDFFKANAPPYMYPREIEFVTALPKTPTGKVLRAELRRLAGARRTGA